MKNIYVKPKYSNSNNQYYEWHKPEDKAYIYAFLAQELAGISEELFKNPNIVTVHTDLFNKRRKIFGNQTGWEFLSGGVNQHINNPNKDISDRQVAGIEELMKYFDRPVKIVPQAYNESPREQAKAQIKFFNICEFE